MGSEELFYIECIDYKTGEVELILSEEFSSMSKSAQISTLEEFLQLNVNCQHKDIDVAMGTETLIIEVVKRYINHLRQQEIH